MQKNHAGNEIQKQCNACGRKLRTLPNGELEETLRIEKTWGYFSRKDTLRHRFVVCEDCYDRLVASFVVPVAETEATEI